MFNRLRFNLGFFNRLRGFGVKLKAYVSFVSRDVSTSMTERTATVNYYSREAETATISREVALTTLEREVKTEVM